MKKSIFVLLLAGWLLGSTPALAAPAQAARSASRVIETIAVGHYPLGIAFNPRNGDLYVANESDKTVSVIDGATDKVIATIPVGSSPREFTYSPRSGDMYVSETFSDTVSVIDYRTNTITASIPVPNDQDCFHPFAMAYDIRNARMFVDCLTFESVVVIDTVTNTVQAVIRTGSSPEGIVFNRRNGYIYAASDHNQNIAVIDGATNKNLRYIDLPPIGSGGSIELGLNPRTNTLYATVSDVDTVVVVDATTEKVVTTLPVGDYPLGVAFYPPDGNMYVANFNDGTVSVIDSRHNAVIDTITVGRGAQWLAFNPRNRSLYVTNSLDGTVSVISPP